MAKLDVVLNVHNVEKSREFYKALGFSVKNEYKDAGTLNFVELSYRGGVSLSLANIAMNKDPDFQRWTSGLLGGGVLISITTSGLDKVHDAAKRAGAEIEQPPTSTQFGRQMTFNDPDGYSLMYWERAPPKGTAKKARTAAKRTRKVGAQRRQRS